MRTTTLNAFDEFAPNTAAADPCGALAAGSPSDGAPARAFETIRFLARGTIVHGKQFIGPDGAYRPTGYYGRRSGIGRTLDLLGCDAPGTDAPGNRHKPLKVAVIGLGVGTLAAYSRPGDEYRFYEINPLVARIAAQNFTFLSGSRATHQVVLGDARLALEREPPHGFDVLVVDAFQGDAIPVHLLTLEAFELYWRHLAPNGVLALHLSNEFVSLSPVAALAARATGRDARLIRSEGNTATAETASDWVLSTARRNFLDSPVLREQARPISPIPGLRMWTDAYSNLYRTLR